MISLVWSLKTKTLSGSIVELFSNAVTLSLSDRTEVPAFGQVLAN